MSLTVGVSNQPVTCEEPTAKVNELILALDICSIKANDLVKDFNSATICDMSKLPRLCGIISKPKKQRNAASRKNSKITPRELRNILLLVENDREKNNISQQK
ncbi:hypothetical protein AKO1_002422 [Acrasis kona]|uniref:Uncharacterized protein n=1 Tax=Acrasis kona TaxID=1008807 RepID=A0AAW2ZQF1_9EUKA